MSYKHQVYDWYVKSEFHVFGISFWKWFYDSRNFVLIFIDGIILLYLLYFDSHIGPGGIHTVNWKCPVLTKIQRLFDQCKCHRNITIRRRKSYRTSDNCEALLFIAFSEKQLFQIMQNKARSLQVVENLNMEMFRQLPRKKLILKWFGRLIPWKTSFWMFLQTPCEKWVFNVPAANRL